MSGVSGSSRKSAYTIDGSTTTVGISALVNIPGLFCNLEFPSGSNGQITFRESGTYLIVNTKNLTSTYEISTKTVNSTITQFMPSASNQNYTMFVGKLS